MDENSTPRASSSSARGSPVFSQSEAGQAPAEAYYGPDDAPVPFPRPLRDSRLEPDDNDTFQQLLAPHVGGSSNGRRSRQSSQEAPNRIDSSRLSRRRVASDESSHSSIPERRRHFSDPEPSTSLDRQRNRTLSNLSENSDIRARPRGPRPPSWNSSTSSGPGSPDATPRDRSRPPSLVRLPSPSRSPSPVAGPSRSGSRTEPSGSRTELPAEGGSSTSKRPAVSRQNPSPPSETRQPLPSSSSSSTQTPPQTQLARSSSSGHSRKTSFPPTSFNILSNTTSKASRPSPQTISRVDPTTSPDNSDNPEQSLVGTSSPSIGSRPWPKLDTEADEPDSREPGFFNAYGYPEPREEAERRISGPKAPSASEYMARYLATGPSAEYRRSEERRSYDPVPVVPANEEESRRRRSSQNNNLPPGARPGSREGPYGIPEGHAPRLMGQTIDSSRIEGASGTTVTPGDDLRFRGESAASLGLVLYLGWGWRLFYFLYPLIIFFHIPLTLFLDITTIYTLVQIALHPSTGDSNSRASRGWWVAVAGYTLCTILWFFCVVILWEYWVSYRRRWKQSKPEILPIYLSTPAFNLSCVRHYSYMCFLFRVRISAFRKHPLVPGHNRFRDGIIETFWWYSQNWPTVIILLPRAAISLGLLFVFTPPSIFTPEKSSEPMDRDSIFFDPGGNLSGYATVIQLINASWAGWRILVVATSGFGLFCLSAIFPDFTTEVTTASNVSSQRHKSVTSLPLRSAAPGDWVQRTRSRIKAVMNFSSNPGAWQNTGTDSLPGAGQLRGSTDMRRRTSDTLAFSRRDSDRSTKGRRPSVVDFMAKWMLPQPPTSDSYTSYTPLSPMPRRNSTDYGTPEGIPRRPTKAATPVSPGMVVRPNSRDVGASTPGPILPTHRKEPSDASRDSRGVPPSGTTEQTLHPNGEPSTLRSEELGTTVAGTSSQKGLSRSSSFDTEESNDPEDEALWNQFPEASPKAPLALARNDLAAAQQEELQRRRDQAQWSQPELARFPEIEITTGARFRRDPMASLANITEVSEEESLMRRGSSRAGTEDQASSRQSSFVLRNQPPPRPRAPTPSAGSPTPDGGDALEFRRSPDIEDDVSIRRGSRTSQSSSIHIAV